MTFLVLLLILHLALAAPTQAPSDFTIVNLYAEVVPHSSSSRYELITSSILSSFTMNTVS